MIERILRSEYVDEVILAISEREGNEILKWGAEYECRYGNPLCAYCGDHDDIMSRTLHAAQSSKTEIIVMLSHDCTLVCPEIIDNLLVRMMGYKADYSSNVITRTFPDGMDVQVFTTEVYKRIDNVIPPLHKTRMWTGWNIFHWREELFPKPKIINLEAYTGHYHPDWHLCLDTPEDKKVIEKIIKYFKSKGEENTFGISNIMSYLKRNPRILKINSKSIPTKLLRKDEA